MDWYEINFPVDEALPLRAEQLTAEFDALFLAAGCPNGMALFAARPEPGRVAFYLSPVAARFADEVIQQFAGSACSPPRAAAVELVDGCRDDDGRRLCAR